MCENGFYIRKINTLKKTGRQNYGNYTDWLANPVCLSVCPSLPTHKHIFCPSLISWSFNVVPIYNLDCLLDVCIQHNFNAVLYVFFNKCTQMPILLLCKVLKYECTCTCVHLLVSGFINSNVLRIYFMYYLHFLT